MLLCIRHAASAKTLISADKIIGMHIEQLILRRKYTNNNENIDQSETNTDSYHSHDWRLNSVLTIIPAFSLSSGSGPEQQESSVLLMCLLMKTLTQQTDILIRLKLYEHSRYSALAG